MIGTSVAGATLVSTPRCSPCSIEPWPSRRATGARCPAPRPSACRLVALHSMRHTRLRWSASLTATARWPPAKGHRLVRRLAQPPEPLRRCRPRCRLQHIPPRQLANPLLGPARHCRLLHPELGHRAVQLPLCLRVGSVDVMTAANA